MIHIESRSSNQLCRIGNRAYSILKVYFSGSRKDICYWPQKISTLVRSDEVILLRVIFCHEGLLCHEESTVWKHRNSFWYVKYLRAAIRRRYWLSQSAVDLLAYLFKSARDSRWTWRIAAGFYVFFIWSLLLRLRMRPSSARLSLARGWRAGQLFTRIVTRMLSLTTNLLGTPTWFTANIRKPFF